MRKGGGKQKGAAFERQICRLLSLWVSDGKRKDCFWRSAMSGGRATVAFRQGEKLHRQAGDITAIAPEGHALTYRFYIECKHLKYIDFRSMIFSKGQLFKIWRRAAKESVAYSKYPLLIIRQNHIPTILCTDRHGLAFLRFNGKVPMVCRDMHVLPLNKVLSTPFPHAATPKIGDLGAH